MPAIPLERDSTLALWWPPAGAAPAVRGCATPDFIVDRPAFEAVQAAAGWQMPAGQWAQLVDESVPGSMVLLRVDGRAVAAACAVQRAEGWIELAWVAVVPAFRGQGLGRQVCAALLARVLASGHATLFGSTQDARLSALKIYLDLGFLPVYRAEKVARWRAVCAALGHAFTPSAWGWPRMDWPG